MSPGSAATSTSPRQAVFAAHRRSRLRSATARPAHEPTPRRREPRSSPPQCAGRALRALANRRVLDPELLQICLVLGRVVVVLPELGAILRHRLFVEPDGWRVLRANQR